MKTKLPIITAIISGIIISAQSKEKELDLTKPSSKLQKFIEEVVDMKDQKYRSQRLHENILFEYQGDADVKPIVERHLADFVRLTGETIVDKPTRKMVKINEHASTTRENFTKFKIYTGQQDDLDKVAKKLDSKCVLRNGSIVWSYLDLNNESILSEVHIFLATDTLRGITFEARLIDELLNSFGLNERSKEIEQSCLSNQDNTFTNLQPIDEAVLKFYYKNVPAGTKPKDFEKIFKEKWGK